MKKIEIVEQIMVALRWAKANWKSLKSAQQYRILNGLKKDIWYASEVNTQKALMRFTKVDLNEVLYEVVEAIYA